MLKAIALAGIFLFTSAVSTAAVSPQKRATKSAVGAPATPQPQGFCVPAGHPC
jgi:hypothetical protein